MVNSLRRPRFQAAVGIPNQPVVVSTSVPTQIVLANPNRASVLLSNFTGTQLVYLFPDNTVSATKYTGFLAGSVGSNVTLYTRKAVWGLANSSAQTLAIWEEEFVDG